MPTAPVQINVASFDYAAMPIVTAKALRAQAPRIRDDLGW